MFIANNTRLGKATHIAALPTNPATLVSDIFLHTIQVIPVANVASEK